VEDFEKNLDELEEFSDEDIDDLELDD
jgi:hypothetical protein